MGKGLIQKARTRREREALDRVVYDVIKPLMLGVLLVFGAYSFDHLVRLPKAISDTMVLHDLLIMGLALLVYWLANRRWLKTSMANQVIVMMALAIGTNISLMILLTGDTYFVLNFVIVIIGAGSVLLSLSWLTAAICLLTLAALVTTHSLVDTDVFIKIAFSLMSAGMVAWVSLLVRLRTYLRLEGIREIDERHSSQLRQRTQELDESYQKAQGLVSELEKQATAAMAAERNALRAKAYAETARIEADDQRKNALEAKEESDLLRTEADRLRAQAESQAKQLRELDKEKTSFFQNISHELRTPLTLILNPIEEEFKGQPDNRNLELALKNSRRLLRLVNQLLDFQKVQTGSRDLEVKSLNLLRFCQVCADYFVDACGQKEIHFSLSYDGKLLMADDAMDDLILVEAEVDALEKVVFNYLSNALKYTPPGGEIELGVTSGSSMVRLFVRDSGPGIAEVDKEKLFQVFSQVEDSTTREYEGTGLGLAYVRDLVDLMDGEVGVDSKKGEGSTFWADLPRTSVPRPIVDILLVEDDEMALMTLSEFIPRSESIRRYKLAANAEEARKILDEFRVRCVISDETMPGESGIELLAHVAEIQPEAKRVLLTGNRGETLLTEAINSAQIHRIFYKPIEVGEFIAAIESFVEASDLEEYRPEDFEEFSVRDWLLADGNESDADSEDSEPTAINDEQDFILVVDDLADMRALIARNLEPYGYRILQASNGMQALKMAQMARPKLIIVDWMMPHMSGPDLILELKHSESEISGIPVILLTAKSDEESKLIGTSIGADAFLGKPFNQHELACVVRNLIALKRRETEVEELNRMLTENVLKRYLPPVLVDKIVSGEISFDQEPRSVTATILFSDIVDFTRLTEELRAKRMARVLNEYLTAMNDVIHGCGGTIDKFIGDAIMVIFGAPTEMVSSEQVQRATQCAIGMQRRLQELNEVWVAAGIPSLQMRIGLHQGPALVGTFGSDKRSDYTAIGPTVNLASRIESVCEPGSVFMSGEMCDHLEEDQVEQAGRFELKGVGPVNVYRLLSRESQRSVG